MECHVDCGCIIVFEIICNSFFNITEFKSLFIKYKRNCLLLWKRFVTHYWCHTIDVRIGKEDNRIGNEKEHNTLLNVRLLVEKEVTTILTVYFHNLFMMYNSIQYLGIFKVGDSLNFCFIKIIHWINGFETSWNSLNISVPSGDVTWF